MVTLHFPNRSSVVYHHFNALKGHTYIHTYVHINLYGIKSQSFIFLALFPKVSSELARKRGVNQGHFTFCSLAANDLKSCFWFYFPLDTLSRMQNDLVEATAGWGFPAQIILFCSESQHCAIFALLFTFLYFFSNLTFRCTSDCLVYRVRCCPRILLKWKEWFSFVFYITMRLSSPGSRFHQRV